MTDSKDMERRARDPVGAASRAWLSHALVEHKEVTTVSELTLHQLKEGLHGNNNSSSPSIEKRILGLDPLIALKTALDGHETFNIQSPGLRIGSFKLVYPTIKSLNDLYLDPIMVDDFVRKLHVTIKDTFQDSVEILYEKPTQSSFILDLIKFASKWRDEVRAKLEADKAVAVRPPKDWR